MCIRDRSDKTPVALLSWLITSYDDKPMGNQSPDTNGERRDKGQRIGFEGIDLPVECGKVINMKCFKVTPHYLLKTLYCSLVLYKTLVLAIKCKVGFTY